MGVSINLALLKERLYSIKMNFVLAKCVSTIFQFLITSAKNEGSTSEKLRASSGGVLHSGELNASTRWRQGEVGLSIEVLLFIYLYLRTSHPNNNLSGINVIANGLFTLFIYVDRAKNNNE